MIPPRFSILNFLMVYSPIGFDPPPFVPLLPITLQLLLEFFDAVPQLGGALKL